MSSFSNVQFMSQDRQNQIEDNLLKLQMLQAQDEELAKEKAILNTLQMSVQKINFLNNQITDNKNFLPQLIKTSNQIVKKF